MGSLNTWLPRISSVVNFKEQVKQIVDTFWFYLPLLFSGFCIRISIRLQVHHQFPPVYGIIVIYTYPQCRKYAFHLKPGEKRTLSQKYGYLSRWSFPKYATDIFRHADFYQKNSRRLVKMYGIRFIVTVHGEIRKFHWFYFLRNYGSLFFLMNLVSLRRTSLLIVSKHSVKSMTWSCSNSTKRFFTIFQI